MRSAKTKTKKKQQKNKKNTENIDPKMFRIKSNRFHYDDDYDGYYEYNDDFYDYDDFN